ncbi:hypothetical protein IFM89_007989 [Coptis chinensis]|uniref:SURF1-like protein n=1 Tax=Coptis chinensis TaxID=261450 RepID=A0A835IN87_9MAGN|nr:hypothetical protein IFM89_007989 [Coptis chinensis]
MSPSSKFAISSISKVLERHTSSFFTNQNHRTAQAGFSFSSSFATNERSLSTVVESPFPSSSEAQGKERAKWSRWLLFLPGAISFGLGTWQILRRQDKVEMLEYRRSRLELEPLSYNSISSSLTGDLGSLEFRRVLCKGVFDESKSIYVGPRSRSISGVTENGYYIITPLMPISENPERCQFINESLVSVQEPVLVNRGWVPRSWRDKYLENSLAKEQDTTHKSPTAEENEGSTWWKFWSKKRKTTKVQGPAITPVKVIGVVRGSENPSIFVPANDPRSGQWFYVNVPMIARAAKLPETIVYIEDINEDVDPRKPYPLPKDVNTLIRSSVMPQDHLNYTLTWYANLLFNSMLCIIA